MTRTLSYVVRGFLAVALLAVAVPFAWADPTAPGPSDRPITLAVTSLVKQAHLSRHPLDREISERCFDMFLKSTDPMKVYFYQSDVDALAKEKDELCDQLRHGDVSFAYKVFSLLLKRIDERVKMVDEILAGPLDFAMDEDMPVNRDVVKYPTTPEEAKDRWQKRIKYDLLVLKSSDKKEEKKEGKEARDKLSRRYHSFARRMHQTDSNELLEMYLNAFTYSFDPHTDYMSPDSQKNFKIIMGLGLEGIGAQLQASDDGYTVVKKLIPGGAAAKDGHLKVEDKIIGVGQNGDGEVVDIVDMKLNDVVKLIRGKPGTTVRLEVIPADGSPRKVYKIAREKIELKDSEARGKIFEVGRKADGKPYRIGVIDLPSFYRDMDGERKGLVNFRSTTRDVLVILEDFKQKGIDGVVLDLRHNGGGSLTESISLTGLFINDGPVVQTKDPDGHVQPFYDVDPGIAWSGPLVVLISKFSASASEILAGAIQDYNRGLIVGDHATHGKGTVQSMLDIGEQLFRIRNAPEMGALKITMQQFYRPNGDSTQRRGVLADVELPSITSHLDVGEVDLDHPLPFDKIAPMDYKRFDDVTPPICQELRKLSGERVKKSEKFQKVVRDIDRYDQRKAKKYITVNEAKFLKERAELSDKAEESALEKNGDFGDSSNIERDYYLDEALAITADYIQLEKSTKTQQHTANNGAW
jgi:carboxyl-terminal processing protease